MSDNYMNAMMENVDVNGVEDIEDIEDIEDENAEDIEDADGNTIISPLKAIRAKCLDCCCGQFKEVKLCPATDCPLWAFRFGKNPYRKGRTFTEEQKIAAGERMKKAREARRKKEENENVDN